MAVAVVTGGSSGIGRAVVEQVATNGNVHVLDNKPSDQPLPPSATHHLVDVGDAYQLTETLRDIVDVEGRVDVLVTCAGIKISRHLSDTTLEEWDRTHDVNLRATFLAVQAVVPAMVAAGSGAIVTIGSPSGNGDPASPMYASAKAGIIGFSKSVAMSLASTGVRINTVVPAFTVTGMTAHVAPEVIRERGATTASGLANEPADIAAAVAYLIGPEARNVSGAVLEIGRTSGEPAVPLRLVTNRE